MHGQVVIITGGSSGIGYAGALHVGQAGAQVVLFARDRRRLQAALRRLRRRGVEARSQVVDVRDAVAVAAAVERVLVACGRIDALINNAGLMLGERSLDSLDPETWRAVIDTNLNGAWYCIRSVLPTMRRQGRGVIVNISSGAAVRTGFLNLAYGVSKAALDRLTLGVAAELGDAGIYCVSLSPPYTATETVQRLYPDRDVTAEAASPEQTAQALLGLLAGDAPRYHGGVVTVREYLAARRADGPASPCP